MMVKTRVSTTPDNKVHGANMGPTWVLSSPDGPHVGTWSLFSGTSHFIVHNNSSSDSYSIVNTALKLKSREISFAHDVRLIRLIVLKFYTQNDSTIVMLCAKFQNVWATKPGVMDERGDFMWM